MGPGHRTLADHYAFAQTSPVYVSTGGEDFKSSEDALFLLQVVQTFWEQVQKRNSGRNDVKWETYRRAVEKAMSVYRNIAR